jgi:DNA-binding response OmpR family regulator
VAALHRTDPGARLGAFASLHKPFNIQELEKRLEEVLR